MKENNEMADFDLSKITGREPPLVTDDERDAEIAYLSDVVANRDRELAALRARVATLEAANTGLATEAQRLKAGLRFYARGLHFSPGNDRDWEDVSGEPPNFLCDEHGNTIEDGTIAKCVLLNQDCGEGWEGDDWPPDELPEETSASAPPVHRLHCFDCALEAERLVAELRKTEDIQSATIRDLHGEIETLCGHLGRIRDGGARTTSGKWLDWTRSTLREVAQDALDRKPVPVFRDAGNKPEQSFSTKETDRG